MIYFFGARRIIGGRGGFARDQLCHLHKIDFEILCNMHFAQKAVFAHNCLRFDTTAGAFAARVGTSGRGVACRCGRTSDPVGGVGICRSFGDCCGGVLLFLCNFGAVLSCFCPILSAFLRLGGVLAVLRLFCRVGRPGRGSLCAACLPLFSLLFLMRLVIDFG